MKLKMVLVALVTMVMSLGAMAQGMGIQLTPDMRAARMANVLRTELLLDSLQTQKVEQLMAVAFKSEPSRKKVKQLVLDIISVIITPEQLVKYKALMESRGRLHTVGKTPIVNFVNDSTGTPTQCTLPAECTPAKMVCPKAACCCAAANVCPNKATCCCVAAKECPKAACCCAAAKECPKAACCCAAAKECPKAACCCAAAKECPKAACCCAAANVCPKAACCCAAANVCPKAACCCAAAKECPKAKKCPMAKGKRANCPRK